eukprot:Cvel_21491.t1-p1 / transcript=Cvel_21491.t1 / gene=Cvel_21491 / organism=Chromera_velia_CCMP2878 / gene_product=hypothetical protein / transcript_product=hypothetical protein / location=Cvel_scaffold2020:7419-13285(-) / protein_length=152 / sequence_SO=supercontig / SO=protein_coding / is_pseudo=false
MRSSLVSLLALSFWAASLLSLSHAATLSGQASGQRKRDRIALSVGADGTLTEEGGVDRGEVFVEVSSRQQRLCSLKVRFNEMFQPQCSLPKVLVSVWAIVHGKTRADEENSFPPTLAAEDAKNFENAYIVENNTGENIDIKIDWIAIEDPSP